MNRELLAVVSGVLTAVCVLPYLRDIYRGTTRPQRVSWFVFAVLSTVAAASQLAEGATAGALLCTGSAVGFTLVFLASIRHGEGGGSAGDYLSLLIVALALVAWIALDRPLIAVGAVIVAEIAAISLTARKAHRDPRSETLATWLIDGLAGVAAIAAVAELSATELLYPVHHTLVNAWVLAAIVAGRATQGSLEVGESGRDSGDTGASLRYLHGDSATRVAGRSTTWNTISATRASTTVDSPTT